MSVPAIGGLAGGSDSVLSVLSTALDGLTLRGEVIANNVANVDTPGFQASSVDFESSLRNAVASGGVTGLQAQVLPTDTPVGEDGNNVDLRKEMMAASQTQFQYQLMTRAVSDQFNVISIAAAGQ